MTPPELALIHTIEKYLALERTSDERHEYLDGRLYPIEGDNARCGEISTNLGWILGLQLRNTICHLRIAKTKVRSGPAPKTPQSRKGLFSYPDLLVVRGEMQFHDEHRDVLLNPTVIIEVLSESTQQCYRGEKFL